MTNPRRQLQSRPASRVRSPLSEMRVIRLQEQITALLTQLYHLEGDPDEIERLQNLADYATSDNIGAIIHDIQLQINLAQRERDEQGLRR